MYFLNLFMNTKSKTIDRCQISKKKDLKNNISRLFTARK